MWDWTLWQCPSNQKLRQKCKGLVLKSCYFATTPDVTFIVSPIPTAQIMLFLNIYPCCTIVYTSEILKVSNCSTFHTTIFRFPSLYYTLPNNISRSLFSLYFDTVVVFEDFSSHNLLCIAKYIVVLPSYCSDLSKICREIASALHFALPIWNSGIHFKSF